MYKKYTKGWIEVICGCMFAGKTEELIRRITTLSYAKEKVLIVKPKLDNRYTDKSEIVTHFGAKADAVFVNNTDDIRKLVEKNSDCNFLIIDEAQFLDEGLVDYVDKLASSGKKIIIGCLDQDFRGKPFTHVPKLLALAEFITKLSAVCVKCGASATRTQRLVNNKPARYDDPLILVSGSESYEARCRSCHKIG